MEGGFLAFPCYPYGMAETVVFSCADTEALRRMVAKDIHATEKSWTLLPQEPAEQEYVVRIPDAYVLEAPLKYRCTGTSAHIVIIVGKNARGVIQEELAGEDGTLSVEIFLEEGAQLEFISINNTPGNAHVRIRHRSQLQANAKISWKNVTLGSSVTEHDLRSELIGANASSAIDWMFYAKDREKYSLTARNIFHAPHGGGEITMKGVVEQQGHVRCDGMIEICKNGGQTNTYLTQNVLMLDKTAKVDAIPGLEINTNDVKASHSATVSRVTDEDLFYFGSRGIAEREARRMFVEGFLGDLLANITDAAARERALSILDAKYSR